MLIKITRKYFTSKSTIGLVSVDGVKCGFSLEDVARPDGVKVYGETAIPAGEYQVTIDYSNKFKKLMPHILDVPNFTGIRIHKGSTPESTSGCVLVGLRKGPDMIYDCAATYDYIYGSIEKALANKEKVTIWIINAPNEL
jgi:hypothetical protein